MFGAAALSARHVKQQGPGASRHRSSCKGTVLQRLDTVPSLRMGVTAQ